MNNKIKVPIGDDHTKVYVAPSKIISNNVEINPGYGLFALENFIKEEIITEYSGFIQSNDIIKNSNIEKIYIVNLWQEMCLCGDSSTGDLGIFINQANKQSDANAR